MYKSKIKENFRGMKFTDKDYLVLFDIGEDKVMIYDDDTKLIYDLYKNKLEDPKGRILFEEFFENYELLLVAKTERYANEYNLVGVYEIKDYFLRNTRSRKTNNYNYVTNLCVEMRGEDSIREIFPSRFKCFKLIDRETKQDFT